MKRLAFLMFLAILANSCFAQQFRTIIGTPDVVAGEPFQIQYVLENMLKDDQFFQPEFKPLQYVSGPNVYTGTAYSADGPVRLSNVVFTVLAPSKGRYRIPGAIATLNGQRVTSPFVEVDVISKEEAYRKGLKFQKQAVKEAYYLAPGEDADAKVRENLFVKLSVDKKTCFVGQPVTATFKLYSRLESKSDVVKNPGFYGFAIQDMISIDDKVNNTEVINGKKFDVHTIRKVQLYPMTAGSYSIDPMEVENVVEFSRSPNEHKPEQQLIEGVINKGITEPVNGKLVVESTMHTEPIGIVVKNLPVEKQPKDFAGGLGKFKIETSLNQKEIAKNEEGILSIKISGIGNLTQIVAPDVVWPKNLDTFDIETTDSLNTKVTPMSGYRVFKIPFQVTSPGTYVIPPVKFSFFDPDSNSYRTISSNSLEVIGNDKLAQVSTIEKNSSGIPILKKKQTNMLLIWISSFVILVLAVIAFLFLKRKSRVVTVKQAVPPAFNTEKYLKAARDLVFSNERLFYITLRRGIWEFLTDAFGISGSTMSKAMLTEKLTAIGINSDTQQQLHGILEICEAGTFTSFTIGHNRESVLIDSEKMLKALHSQKPA